MASSLNVIGRDCLAVRVRLLSRTITRLYDAALRPHGLTIAQLNLLATVENLQPAASNRVAEMLSMEISTLSRNARIVEEEGWITVEHAERGNGRVLGLTEAGRKKLAEIEPAWATAQQDTETLLGSDGAKLIKELVDGLWADRLAARGRAPQAGGH